jgi:hypothetical protein
MALEPHQYDMKRLMPLSSISVRVTPPNMRTPFAGPVECNNEMHWPAHGALMRVKKHYLPTRSRLTALIGFALREER